MSRGCDGSADMTRHTRSRAAVRAAWPDWSLRRKKFSRPVDLFPRAAARSRRRPGAGPARAARAGPATHILRSGPAGRCARWGRNFRYHHTPRIWHGRANRNCTRSSGHYRSLLLTQPRPRSRDEAVLRTYFVCSVQCARIHPLPNDPSDIPTAFSTFHPSVRG